MVQAQLHPWTFGFAVITMNEQVLSTDVPNKLVGKYTFFISVDVDYI